MEATGGTLLLDLAKNAGTAGVILGLALLYIWKLHKDLQTVQEQRVQDAKAMVEKLLALNDKWNETLTSFIEQDHEGNKVLTEVRTMIQELYLEAKR